MLDGLVQKSCELRLRALVLSSQSPSVISLRRPSSYCNLPALRMKSALESRPSCCSIHSPSHRSIGGHCCRVRSPAQNQSAAPRRFSSGPIEPVRLCPRSRRLGSTSFISRAMPFMRLSSSRRPLRSQRPKCHRLRRRWTLCSA